eukprot:403344476
MSVSSRPRDISLSIKNVEELYQSSANALDLQKSFRTSSNNQNQHYNYRGFSPMPDMGGSQPFDNRSDRSNISHSQMQQQQNTPTPAQHQQIQQNKIHSHQFNQNKYRDNSMILVDDDNNINISQNQSYNISSQQQNSNYINFRKKSNQTNLQYKQGINMHSNKTVQEADNDKEDDVDISGFDYKVDQTEQSNYLSNQIQM